jgi:cyclophilin family peptidyl-prolyl cis-trans isomerase
MKKSMYQRFLLSIIAIAAISVAGCSSPVTRVAGEPFATHTALIQTTMGDIEVELYGEDAPKTVENFVGLANKGYYDGILFHRVISGFMIQVGDPNTKDPSKKELWGTGGESIYGPTFADELNPEAPSYKRGYKQGVLAMANAGPNTNSSQFFIMHTDYDRLPKNYSIFGKVTKGMEVVNAIATTPRDARDRPNIPVAITTIKARKL